MSFKTTILLLGLVAAGAALTTVGVLMPSFFHLAPPVASESPTRAALEKLNPKELTGIELHKGKRVTTLARKNGVWSMPGKWPTRTIEVNALVELLGGLRTRFESIPITDKTNLESFGLTESPLTVRLE